MTFSEVKNQYWANIASDEPRILVEQESRRRVVVTTNHIGLQVFVVINMPILHTFCVKSKEKQVVKLRLGLSYARHIPIGL